MDRRRLKTGEIPQAVTEKKTMLRFCCWVVGPCASPSPLQVVCGRVFAWCYITLPTVTECPWPNTRQLAHRDGGGKQTALEIKNPPPSEQHPGLKSSGLLVLTVLV